MSLGTILRDPGEAPFDGSDWLWSIRSGPAVGRLRVQRGENDGATTRGDKRRTFEDRSDPVAYRRGECEEKSRKRAGGPPAGSPARYKYSPSFTLTSFSLVAESSTHLRIVRFLSFPHHLLIRERIASEVASRNFNPRRNIVPSSSPVRDFNERCLVSGSSTMP